MDKHWKFPLLNSSHLSLRYFGEVEPYLPWAFRDKSFIKPFIAGSDYAHLIVRCLRRVYDLAQLRLPNASKPS